MPCSAYYSEEGSFVIIQLKPKVVQCVANTKFHADQKEGLRDSDR